MKIMKKIVSGLFLLTLVLFFAACKEKNITVTYDDLNITRNKIDLELNVDAPVNSNNKIKKCVRAYLRNYEEDGQVGSEAYRKEITVQSTSLSMTGLSSETNYQFSVETCDGDAEVLFTEDIKTNNLGQDETTPIEITTIEDFTNISNDLEGYYVLKNDLDFTDQEYTPIGNTTNRFKGTLDGQGYTIKNVAGLSFSSSTQKAYGLIAINEGTIKNLKIDTMANRHTCNGDTDADCEATPSLYSSNYNYTDFYMGALVGQNRGIIDNVQATGITFNVRSDKKYTSYDFMVGGLIGLNNGTVTNSSVVNSSVNVNEVKRKAFVGGLIGSSQPNSSLYRVPAIANCYTDASVYLYFTYYGDMRVGGFIGESEGSEIFNNCYSTGNIRVVGRISSSDTFEKDLGVGGFAGYFNSTGEVRNIYASGNINVELYNMDRSQIGGLIGAVIGATGVYNSFTTSNITVTSDTEKENIVVNELAYTSKELTNLHDVYSLSTSTIAYSIVPEEGETINKSVERINTRTAFTIQILEDLLFSTDVWTLIENAPTLK